MEGIPTFLGLAELSFPRLVAALFVVVLLRAQATYWLGRAVASTVRSRARRAARGGGGDLRHRAGAGLARRWADVAARVERWSHGPGGRRAVALLQRWGPVAVTSSFLTVGVQTAVNAAAGLTRMPFRRYLVAMVPGCLAWAFVYATVGFGALYGAVAVAAGSPWAVSGVVVVLVAVVAVVLRRRRRMAGAQGVERDTAGSR